MASTHAGLSRTVFIVLALAWCAALGAQADGVQSHVDKAKAAAGQEFPSLFTQLCVIPAQSAPPASAPAVASPATPDRSTWHVEPSKVFDNLYFVGQSEYSAWAVTTSAGIIVIDAIFGYAVEDEVVGGLKKLGL